MNPPILLNFLDEAVGIGGFQLGEHPVVHDGGDNGVASLQLFQHIGVGGVAGFGFLHRRQSQFFKQQLSQLLCGIDIEGAVGIGEDQFFTVGNPPGEHIAELLQLLAVNGDALPFHAEEHRAQGQLDAGIQGGHAVLFQLSFQHRAQLPHGFGTACRVGILHADAQKGGGQLGQRVFRLRGIQVVSGQSGVENHFSGGQSIFLHAVQGGPGIMQNQPAETGKSGTGQLELHRRQSTYAGFPGHAQTAVRREIQRAFGNLRRKCIRTGQGFDGPGGLGHFLLRAPQTVFVDETDELQLLKQPVQLRPVHGLFQRILRREINGGFRHDGSQLIGQVGAFPTVFQLFPELGPDGRVLNTHIHAVQTAEFRQQLCGSLGPHAGDAGDVVGGVAHQGFQIHHPGRLKAVFFIKLVFVIEGCRSLAGLGDHQLYLYMVVDELQTVPVAGDDDAVPPVVGADFPHGADHVVGLPALTGVDGDIHGGEDLFHHRHLLGQFFGHAVTVGLVAIVFHMPEGGAVEVKGHTDRVGILFLLHPLQNVQKAVDGVGIQPVPGGQRLHAEEGPVDNTVAIQNH